MRNQAAQHGVTAGPTVPLLSFCCTWPTLCRAAAVSLVRPVVGCLVAHSLGHPSSHANVVLTAIAFRGHGATLLADFGVRFGSVGFSDGSPTFLANPRVLLGPVLRPDRLPAMLRMWCPWLGSALLACHRWRLPSAGLRPLYRRTSRW